MSEVSPTPWCAYVRGKVVDLMKLPRDTAVSIVGQAVYDAMMLAQTDPRGPKTDAWSCVGVDHEKQKIFLVPAGAIA